MRCHAALFVISCAVAAAVTTITAGEPPKVDFSYAFATPHRITVGRPTNSDRTLLDLQPGKLRMSWSFMGLTQFPLTTYMIPKNNSHTWGVDVTPQIDGKPFANSRWTRVDGFLPALDNRYDESRGSMRVEVIGADTAALARVEVANTDTVRHQYLLLCETHHGYTGINYAWIDPGRWAADSLIAAQQDRADRVLMLGLGADRWTSSTDGRPLAPGTLSFIWNLSPGEKRTAWLVRPYRAYEVDLPALRKHDWAREAATAKQEWRELIDRTSRVSIPDPDVVNALHACFADLFIMREPVANGYVGVLCGTEVYRAPNSSEPIIAGIAMDQFGLHGEAAESQRLFLDLQGADGDWADPTGWNRLYWWAPGFKAWAIHEHYHLTGDRAFLAKVYPRMLASSRFLESQRARTRVMEHGQRPLTYGLMPRGMGDAGLMNDKDLYGVFLPHNIWAVYADRVSVEAAGILGKTEDLPELRRIYQTAYADLLQSIERGAIQEKDYRWIPGVPGKTCGSRFGVLNALFPCHLLAPDHELINGTLRYIERNISPGGIPVHTGWMKDGMWVAMALDNVAEAHLARGNGDAAAHYLYATLNHGTPLFTWCEERGQEPGTKKISGDRQHLWTPVAVVRILRDMLVMERDDGLDLALGTAREWLASGKPVGIAAAPTHHGPVSYQMQYAPTKSIVTGEIKFAPDSTAAWAVLHIRLPGGLKVKSVDVNSGAVVEPDGPGIRWKSPRGAKTFRVTMGT
jgi:hypothetical protein